MEPENTKKKKHHFLYYIFKTDKEQNPMPKKQAENLFEIVKNNINLTTGRN